MIPTGDPALDLGLDGGYQPGALHIVAGAPGSGKTNWLRRSIRLALDAGKTAHVVDLESTLQRHFQGEPRVSSTSSFRPLEWAQIPANVDLLVIDCIQQHVLPMDSHQVQIAGMARWLGSQVVPMLRELHHPVKLLSWQDHRRQDRGQESWDNVPVIPKALNHAADVVLYLDRDQGQTDDRGFKAVLRKNRFGTTGGVWEYTLPEAKPIIRPTIWERLEET